MKRFFFDLIKNFCVRSNILLIFLPASIRILVKNKRYWKEFESSSKGYIVAEVCNYVYLALGTAFTANILRIFYKLDIIYIDLYPNNNDDYLHELRNSFSKSKYISIENFRLENEKRIEQLTQSEFEKIKNVNDLHNYRYDDVPIGDLLYDVALREGSWTATIKNIDSKVKKALRTGIISIEFAKDLTSKYNIEVCSFSHNSGDYGFLLKYFARDGKKVFMGTLGASLFKKVILKDDATPYYSQLDPSFPKIIFNDPKLKKKFLDKANTYFQEYSKGKIVNMDFSGAFDLNAPKFKSKEAFCKKMQLDPNKRNVFLMLHAFNDFPKTFITPYHDFYDWMIKTVDVLKENDRINCIIKVHPMNKLYPTTDFNIIEYLDDLVSSYDHIKYIDEETAFTNESIPFIADVIGTCVGTSALEYTCYGKKTFSSGTSSYSQFNICDNIEDQKDYRDYLLSLDKLNLDVPEATQEKAKLVFYLDYAVIMTAGTNSINAFPLVTHIERLEDKKEKLFKYYISKIGSAEFDKELKRVINFLKNENEITFFIDEQLAKVEELSNR
jgi:hypothetical protein